MAAVNVDSLIKRFPEVQLAMLVDSPPAGAQWLHEVKFDGYRLLGYSAGGQSSLRTRNGNDWTSKMPSLARELAAFPIESLGSMERS